jgi:hypothetical protein
MTTTTTSGSATNTTLTDDELSVQWARYALPFYRRTVQLAPPAVAPQLHEILHYVTLMATADLTTEAGTAQMAEAKREALNPTGGEELDNYMHKVCHIPS